MSTSLGRKRTYDEACEDHKQAAPVVPTTKTAGSSGDEPVFSKQLLQVYYDRLFPYQDMFNWLSYFNDPTSTAPSNDAKVWRNREWSFTLKDDIYVRYKSYKDLASFRADLRRKCPFKIDIGALYNIEPSRRRTIASDKFIAEEKELVFDIDISDYDDVRSCCSGAGICTQCWPLMCCAVDVLDASLRNDFGLQHLLWVFSGRRGIHCWCGDAIVRKFDVRQRSALVDYLKVYSGNSMSKYKVNLQTQTHGIHASLQRAFAICQRYFVSCSLEMQGCLDSEEGVNMFCGMIRFDEIRSVMKDKLMGLVDSVDCVQKWMTIQKVFDPYLNGKEIKFGANKGGRGAIRANLYECVFAYVYPRLDVEVSRHVNHLLKSPFCIHPKTGKVCSIIDPRTVAEFDPCTQPTLLSLVNEYNAKGKENDGVNSSVGWRDTSLKGIVDVFRETFLNGIEQQRKQEMKMQSGDYDF